MEILKSTLDVFRLLRLKKKGSEVSNVIAFT